MNSRLKEIKKVHYKKLVLWKEKQDWYIHTKQREKIQVNKIRVKK
jgi:hypothetical protein